MKVVKPQKLGVLVRPYERSGGARLAVAALAYVAFDAPDRLLQEVAMWRFVGEALGGAPLDVGLDKPRGEVLVHGACHAPGGIPATEVRVRVGCGPVERQLVVSGDRVFREGVPTAPEPFVVMPLSPERAFGGPGFPDNPRGKGAPASDDEEAEGRALPNVEDEGARIVEPADRPPCAAGLGPVDLSAPTRLRRAGTHDEAWLRERAPFHPDDLDPTFFNEAPEAQWLEGHFTGEEGFVLEGLHPTKPRLEGRLPAVVARAFVERRGGLALEEVAMPLETVHLFPEAERAIAIFRGALAVEEDDASDLEALVLAFEPRGAPRPVEHYAAVLTERRDPERAESLLRDGDLCPTPPPEQVPGHEERLSDMEVLLAREGHLEANLRRGAARDEAERTDALLQAGIAPSIADAAAGSDAIAPVDDLAAIATSLAEERRAAEAARAAVEAEQQERLQAFGVTSGIAPEARGVGGPPAFRAEDELEKLRAQALLAQNAGVSLPFVADRLADPEFARRLHAIEAMEHDTYRRTAHRQPPPAPVTEAEARARRDELVRRVEAGLSCAGVDLTGADLRGLPLANADLSGAFLEAADATGADLSGARLERTVLARAVLERANLQGAALREANLGLSRLGGARATAADLTDALLEDADLGDADLTGVNLEGASLAGARLAAADLTGARARAQILHKASLAGARLAGADLTRASLLEVDLTRADLAGATLTSALLLGVRAERATLTGASAENLRAVMGTSFASAELSGALLCEANLRESRLVGAELGRANLERADLSGADLSDANLEAVGAVDARFVRTRLDRADVSFADLRSASLEGAHLAGADLGGASLFRADLARSERDDDTNLQDANLTQARQLPPRRPDDRR
ncbi:MAG: DUF2169 domain-containing protein [Deltaproteobacteria bacterium]|nr:DUF2169 domain-containing protein [Deltaproteobacteria bacterium]